MFLWEFSQVVDKIFYHQFMCQNFFSLVNTHNENLHITNFEGKDNFFVTTDSLNDCCIFCSHQQTRLVSISTQLFHERLSLFLDDVLHWWRFLLKLNGIDISDDFCIMSILPFFTIHYSSSLIQIFSFLYCFLNVNDALHMLLWYVMTWLFLSSLKCLKHSKWLGAEQLENSNAFSLINLTLYKCIHGNMPFLPNPTYNCFVTFRIISLINYMQVCFHVLTQQYIFIRMNA